MRRGSDGESGKKTELREKKGRINERDKEREREKERERRIETHEKNHGGMKITLIYNELNDLNRLFAGEILTLINFPLDELHV